MIAYVSGEVAGVGADSAVIDCGGIGYRIYMPGDALEKLNPGDEKKIYTYLSVREDALQLYGFLSEKDLEMFRLLIGVSGIGPKGALGVLGTMRADDIRFAVLSEDAAAIAKAPGIGKKTAQKVILELKDKLSLEDISDANAENEAAAGHAEENGAAPQTEAVLALKALGYGGTEAWKAVKKAAETSQNADTESLIRAALKYMV